VTTLAFAASHGQERLWFADQVSPDASPFVLVAGLELRGSLDADRLTEAIEQVIELHEILRTTLVRRDHTLLQVIHQTVPPAWKPVVGRDAARLGETTPARLARLDEQARSWRPDLASGPLIRLTLAELALDHWVLHLAIHHTVADAVTLKLFLQQVAAAYRGEQLPAPRLQYADVSGWQRARSARGEFAGDKAYWLDRLHNLPTVTWDVVPRDDAHGAPGVVYPGEASGLNEALHRLATERQSPAQAVLLAAVGTAVCLDLGLSRVAVGIPVDGRTRSDLRGLLGFLVNSVTVPVAVSPNEPFTRVLDRVAVEYVGALAHQELPFDEVVRAVAPTRGLTTSPVFHVIVTTHAALLDGLDFPGVELIPRPVTPPALPAPLVVTLPADDAKEPFTLSYDYPLGRTQAQRLAATVGALLLDAVSGRALAISDLAARPSPEVQAQEKLRSPSIVLQTPPAALVDLVARVLADALGRDRPLPADAHFFQFGGHSLVAIQALDDIAAELEMEVPLALIFEHPVVADLAAALHAQTDLQRSAIPRQPRVPHGR